MKKTPVFCFLFCVLYCHTFAQLTVATISNTSCGSPNGSASATVGGSTTGYTFEWRIGADDSSPVFFTGPVVSNLSSGTYSVHAIDQSTSVDIGNAVAMVNDAIVLTQATVESTSNTACSDSPNGSLTATANGVASDYAFAWYLGTDTNGTIIATGATLSNVDGGIYTVKVTNVSSSCFAVVTAQVAVDCQIPSPGFSEVAGELVTNQKKADSSPISFYPNPVSTTLFLLSQVNASLSLLDKDGTNIATRSVSPAADPFTLDLSGVKPGRYILRVKESQRTTSYQVIVKK